MLYFALLVNFPPSIPEIGPEVDGIHIAFLIWLQPSEMRKSAVMLLTLHIQLDRIVSSGTVNVYFYL